MFGTSDRYFPPCDFAGSKFTPAFSGPPQMSNGNRISEVRLVRPPASFHSSSSNLGDSRSIFRLGGVDWPACFLFRVLDRTFSFVSCSVFLITFEEPCANCFRLFDFVSHIFFNLHFLYCRSRKELFVLIYASALKHDRVSIRSSRRVSEIR